MIQATGKLRRYQIANCLSYLSVLPISIILYKLGTGVSTIFLFNIAAAAFMVFFMADYLNKITDFSWKEYVKGTIIPCFMVTTIVLPLYALRLFFAEDLGGFLVKSIVSVIWIVADAYFLGLTPGDRNRIKNLIAKVIHKSNK